MLSPLQSLSMYDPFGFVVNHLDLKGQTSLRLTSKDMMANASLEKVQTLSMEQFKACKGVVQESFELMMNALDKAKLEESGCPVQSTALKKAFYEWFDKWDGLQDMLVELCEFKATLENVYATMNVDEFVLFIERLFNQEQTGIFLSENLGIPLSISYNFVPSSSRSKHAATRGEFQASTDDMSHFVQKNINYNICWMKTCMLNWALLKAECVTILNENNQLVGCALYEKTKLHLSFVERLNECQSLTKDMMLKHKRQNAAALFFPELSELKLYLELRQKKELEFCKDANEIKMPEASHQKKKANNCIIS